LTAKELPEKSREACHSERSEESMHSPPSASALKGNAGCPILSRPLRKGGSRDDPIFHACQANTFYDHLNHSSESEFSSARGPTVSLPLVKIDVSVFSGTTSRVVSFASTSNDSIQNSLAKSLYPKNLSINHWRSIFCRQSRCNSNKINILIPRRGRGGIPHRHLEFEKDPPVWPR
jgi:hypothetical protein